MAQSPLFMTNIESQQLQHQQSFSASSSSASATEENSSTHQDEQRIVTKDQIVGGAAVAGGLAGLVLMGPVVGLLAAGGAAFAASMSKGKAGQVARATGEVTVQAGKRLQRFDKKHHVMEKTSKSVVKGCHWVSDRLQPQQNRGSSSAGAATNGSSTTSSRVVGQDRNVQAAAALMT